MGSIQHRDEQHMLQLRPARVRRTCRQAVLTLAVCAGACSTALAESGSWPAYRGADGTAQVDGDGVFATGEISLHVAWKKPVGSGYSAMAIDGGRVVTMFSDGESDVVAAFDQNSGQELWRHAFSETYPGKDGAHTGPIATPLISGGRAFCLGPKGEWFALDVKTGEVAWSANIVKQYEAKKPHYGFTSSPIMMDGVIVLQIAGKDGAVAGFDPATGDQLWAVGQDMVDYQSPIPYELLGRKQVLAATNTKLMGIDPKSGELLWDYAHQGNAPTGAGSMTPVPAGFAGGAQRLFLAFKPNASTTIAIKAHATEERLDPPKSEFDIKSLWEDRAIRNSYNVPVYHDGHIYAYSSRILTCVDAGTGEIKWRSRDPGDGFTILVDGHLVLATKEGGLHIAPASTAGYTEKAAIPQLFDDLIWCSPAFAQSSIYVRSLGEMARIDVRRGAAVASGDAPSGGQPPADSKLGHFLREVQAASDKGAAIDRFMAGVDFPVVDNNWVHFVYRGKGTDVAVGGDIIGARQERQLNRVDGTDLFYYSMQVEADTRSNYLFIRDYEEILDPGNPRKTSTKMLTRDMEMNFTGQPLEMSWFAMPKWQPPTHLGEPSAGRKGRLVADQFTSGVMVDQLPPWMQPAEGEDSKPKPSVIKMDVYLPAGYDDNADKRYPVAYFMGGTSAMEDGQVPVMLDNLIGERVTPLLMVFVHKDAPAFGDPSQFMSMFGGELIPHVDGKYRTLAAPESRAILGTGFSGTTAFMVAFSSGQAAKLGCHGPFVFDSFRPALDGMMRGPDQVPMQIYMDWGKYDMRNPHENWDIGDINRSLSKAIKAKGYTVAGGEANDGTGWSSWQNRTDDMLEALFPIR